MPPTAAVPINAVEMIIFGGNNQRCYTFNVQEVSIDSSGNGKVAKLKPIRDSQLREVADFCAGRFLWPRIPKLVHLSPATWSLIWMCSCSSRGQLNVFEHQALNQRQQRAYDKVQRSRSQAELELADSAMLLFLVEVCSLQSLHFSVLM